MIDNISSSNVGAIVLAAGQGTRMKSQLPKVMHEIAGRPLLHYGIRAALEAGCAEVVAVVGHGRERVSSYVRQTFPDRVKTAVQEEQRGTGDATKAGLVAVTPEVAIVLVFYGDVPLVTAEDLARVVRALHDYSANLAFATCQVKEPRGYGRVLRDAAGSVLEIREEKDLRSESERATTEINPGIFVAERAFLDAALRELQPNNAQGEYYLTDIVSLAGKQKLKIATVPSCAEILLGVNDRDQLVAAETIMLDRIARGWRRGGVTVRPGARIEDAVTLEPDTTVNTGAVLRGATHIARGACIDIGAVLTNVRVGENAIIKPYSVLTDSQVGPEAQIGPFSHLRPQSEIGPKVHVGNFVETKKIKMEEGAKANHLAYLGDGVIGRHANIGAGTIFCNYDGFQKHQTTIGEGAFIGSDSQIVAPVVVGAGAYVATGTTVTKDVPADALAISRVRQENKDGYAARLRAKLKAAKDKG